MADFGTAVAQNALGDVAGNLVDRILKLISNPISLVLNMKANVENLKKQVDKLKEEMDHVERFIQAAERRGEEMAPKYKNWRDAACKFLEAANTIEGYEEKAKKKCFFGMCLNPLSRYKLSKKAVEDSQKIAKHVQNVLEYRLPPSYPPIPQREVATPVKDFQEFESRKDVLDEIMKALQSPSINKIGLHGMPGVGKTMLLKEVKRKAEQDKLFDVVVMVSVTKKDPDYRKLQDNLAFDLGLELPAGIGHRSVADRLKARFLKERKILVILDDIWDKIDLEALGIPFKDQQIKNVETGSSSPQDQQLKCKNLLSSGELNDLSTKMGSRKEDAVGQLKHQEAWQMFNPILGDSAERHELQPTGIKIVDKCGGLPASIAAPGISFEGQHKMNVETGSSSTGDPQMRCKILLASRELHVLSIEMGTQKEIVISQLEDQEAWQMFKKIVGDAAESSKLHPTGFGIVTECQGLPLAIATLAKALKNKSLPEWRSALQRLKNPSPSNFTGIHAKVYTAIEVSYNHLGSEELKQTLLLSSLMGHNAFISDLLKYGVGLGLFSQATTIEGARDELLTLISDLKASSLLLDGSDGGRVDVHGVIRDVALSIALRDRHGLLLTDDCLLNKWSEEKALNDFKWISLENANMNELPDELESPQLTFFCLTNKYPSLEIPATFFKGMQRLRVLDLTRMQMSSLPLSISLLKNLHTLCLDQSVLGDISIIGELKNLEVLSLLRSDIKMLPREIGQLTRLKLLDLTGCSRLKVIPPRVLASMSRLEELYLGNSFNRWEHDERENQQNASLAELKHLKKLTALEVCIRDLKMIPEGLSFEKLERYKIFIGDAWNKWDSSPERSRILKLQLTASISFDSSLKQLLKMSEELHLEELKGVKNVLDELDGEGFQELKYLHIHNAPDIQRIIMDAAGLCNAFPTLEVLCIRSLVNLETICYGQLRTSSFCRLKIINVECCNQLKKLFSFSTARQLFQLQEIGVTDCRNMVKIVDEEGKEDVGDIVEATDQMVELGHLLSLRLQNLPKFISFCHENDTSSSHVPLFSEKFAFPYLEKLQLARINITTIWPPLATPDCIQNLTELLIQGCDNLEHLFSSSMARGLGKLRDLKINQCKKMREIIVTENVEEMQNLISFPKLDFLQIQDLQNLVRFYSGNCIIEVPSLKRLTIENCPKLKKFTVKSVSTDAATDMKPLFNEQLEVFNLESLKLSGNINIQQIWHNRVPEMSSLVRNIIECTVEDCGNLKYLLTSYMVKSLEHLQCLIVKNCKMMEGIIVTEEGSVEEETTLKIIFPNLQVLLLDDLPKLKRFCSGNYIALPCLTGMVINQCPLLKAFTSSPVIGDIAVSTDKNTSTLSLFDAKVAVPVLETLAISNMEGLHKIWHNQLNAESFCKLRALCVMGCETLESIFPFSMLERLQRLEQLLIIGCDSLEVIFEAQGHVASYSQPLVDGQPTSVETENKLVLPKLTELRLHVLPKLKGFCHSKHITECPSLMKLAVFGFQQLEIFALEFPSFQSTTCDEQLETRVQQSLFLINKTTFPNLEELELGMIGSQIWHGQYAGDLFPKLKKLELINLGGQSVVPPFFFQSLPSIENLAVSCASLDERFQREESGGEGRPAGALTQLREFLVPSIISLRNLQALEVSRCHGLISLMRYPTAKSLVQLTRMSISECDMIEIVACMDDEGKDGIVFSQLKYLQLKGLPKLATFCSVECNFEFPSLEDIIVMDCPNMQFFSEGELITPKLQKVKLTEDDEGRWEGDLNATLHQLKKSIDGSN